MQMVIAGPVMPITIKVVHPVVEFPQMLIPNTIAIIGLVMRVIENQSLVV